MRILVFGAGVIGSVYGGFLHQTGHQVTLFARGSRLTDLQTSGLTLENAHTGRRRIHHLPVLAELGEDADFDLVLVAVRREQFAGATSLVSRVAEKADVLLFGNAAGLTGALASALGPRALFGFPAAGGVRRGAVIRYVLIRQQKTMLAEPSGALSARVQDLAAVLDRAGFSTKISTDAEGWLMAHAAFVVPIAFALYRTDVDPSRLARNTATLRLMVRTTRQAFDALRAMGNAQIPANLRALYLYSPESFAVAYWRHTMASPKGELWFAAHTRAARAEMTSLASALQHAIERSGRPAPDLAALLSTH